MVNWIEWIAVLIAIASFAIWTGRFDIEELAILVLLSVIILAALYVINGGSENGDDWKQ